MKNPKSQLKVLLIVSALLGTTHLVSAAPATDTWLGNTDVNWSTPGNWTGGNAPPQAGDALVFGSAGTSGATLNNNLTAGTAIDGITFSGGSAFTLNGHSVLLSETNVLTVGNLLTIGVYNLSGVVQTFGMPLSLDWGYYIFTSPSGGGIALNGGLTPNLGGVAYFDTTITSGILATDGTGLIAGLGGAGLMYNGNPTGLATILGGSIQAYTGYTPVTSGNPIGNGNNLNLTATGATGTYTAANNTVNTISAAQAGTQTTTLTITTGDTLTLGQQGGIYALAASSNPNALTVTGGTLTAGTTAGASMVFGTHSTAAGNSPANVMTVSSVIANNPGGAVSVVKVGNSSMVINGANTYSGGTYLDQGQIQIGANANALGTGPVYIAPGATLLNNVSPSGSPAVETILNNFFLSTGTGSALWSTTAVNPGAFIYCFADGTFFFNGVFTLMGAPVASATYPPTAGCRIIGNKDAGAICVFQNQITGTGTLDLCTGPHADYFEFSDNPGSHPANNWQGGLIIEQDLASPTSLRTILVQLKFSDQIPNGSQAGDVTMYGAANSGSFINGSTVTLDLNGFNETINGLNGSSAGNVNTNIIVTSSSSTASSILTFGDNNASGSYAGITSDNSAAHNLSLVKIGSGTETFSATLGHHGNTTVSQGTMALSGACTINNTPVITVASGAILDVNGLSAGLTVGAAQTLNCVGTVNGNLTINGTIQSLDAIGTLTDTGSMTFNNGGTYVWDINKATGGTQGTDPGWSLLNISGQLNLSSLSASSFTINVTSLTAGDVIGSAVGFNPNANYSFPIAHAAGGITGFSSSQFSILTSAFANDPNTSSQWSVSLDNTGTYLMLNFDGFAAITTPLPATAVTISQNGGNAPTVATFTVTANALGTSPSFAWTQQGQPLSGSGTSVGGGAYTVSTSNGGYTSTLTISGADQSPQWPGNTDSGPISVTVSETYSSATQMASSTEQLNVVDLPNSPNVTQSSQFLQATPPVSAGAVNVLTATANGSAPLTYQWYLNGNMINGATGAIFNLNVSGSAAGNYTVVIGNSAGNVTSSSTTVAPVSVVPNQIIFEPFNYTQQAHNASPPQPAWSAFGVTNVYNQATGLDVAWINVGNNDFGTQPSYELTDPYTVAPYGTGTRPIVNDEYPVSGLAGNDVNAIYADSDVNGGQVNLPLGSTNNSGTVYFSTVVMLWGMNQNPTVFNDYLCGFDSGAPNSTTHSFGLYIEENTAAVFPNVPYTLGIFKGNLTTAQLNPGPTGNGDWSHNTFLDYNVLFVVGRMNFTTTPATCDLWINPPASYYYAGEGNLPPADVANAAGSVADVAGGVSSFFMKITTWPVDRLFSDLRVGTTWASVTPPSAPTLSLANQVLSPGETTVVFASQNAGNPVSAYQWQFNGGTPLTDGPHYSGTGTGTLTVSNPTAADLGTYTVTGVNTSPAPSDNSATLTGSASATLTLAPIPSIAYSAPNVIVSWPTSYTGWTLEHTTSLSPSSWTTAGLSAPVVVGANYTVTVNATVSGTQFFRLKH